jgi:hypothetical protein
LPESSLVGLLMVPVECENSSEQIARDFDDLVLRWCTSSSRFLPASVVLSSPLWPRLLAQADATPGNNIHFHEQAEISNKYNDKHILANH